MNLASLALILHSKQTRMTWLLKYYQRKLFSGLYTSIPLTHKDLSAIFAEEYFTTTRAPVKSVYWRPWQDHQTFTPWTIQASEQPFSHRIKLLWNIFLCHFHLIRLQGATRTNLHSQYRDHECQWLWFHDCCPLKHTVSHFIYSCAHCYTDTIALCKHCSYAALIICIL